MTGGPLDIAAEEDAGAATQHRYSYQHHCTAIHCIMMVRDHDIRRIVCEVHEDILVEYETDQVALVNIKHRDKGQGPWKIVDLCIKGGVGHLFGRWTRFPPVSLTLMTNAQLQPGKAEAEAVSAACAKAADGVPFDDEMLVARDVLARALLAAGRAKGFEGIPVTPKPPRGKVASLPDGFADTVERFMRVLRICPGLPERHDIDSVHIEKEMRPCVEKLGFDEAIAKDCYRRLMTKIHDLNMALPLTGSYGNWVSSISMRRQSGQTAALVLARSITPADVLDLIRAAAAHAAPRRKDPHGPDARLNVKLVAGGVKVNRRQRFRRLREEWITFWADARRDLPGDAEMLADLEQQVERIVEEIEDAFTVTEDAWGATMVDGLTQRLASGLTTESGFVVPPRAALGLVMDLVARCQVWFSDEFDVDGAINEAQARHGRGA